MVEPHADNGADAEHTAEAGADGANSARPRRADAETLTYLRSLEPLIEQSVRALDERLRGQRQGPGRRGGGGGEEEGDGADEEAAEDRALLVSNLINELTYKVRMDGAGISWVVGLVGWLGGSRLPSCGARCWLVASVDPTHPHTKPNRTTPHRWAASRWTGTRRPCWRSWRGSARGSSWPGS